jgi:hypothetical protein
MSLALSDASEDGGARAIEPDRRADRVRGTLVRAMFSGARIPFWASAIALASTFFSESLSKFWRVSASRSKRRARSYSPNSM